MRNKSSELLEYIEVGFESISLKCLKNMRNVYQDKNNVVLVENNFEWKACINIESNSLELTIKLYSCHDINMKFRVVVTPPSIYHGCSTRKMFWEENFTGKQDLFESVNMKNCGHCNVRKHKEIRCCVKCVTLNIYEIWISQRSLTISTRRKAHLQSQKYNWRNL